MQKIRKVEGQFSIKLEKCLFWSRKTKALPSSIYTGELVPPVTSPNRPIPFHQQD